VGQTNKDLIANVSLMQLLQKKLVAIFLLVQLSFAFLFLFFSLLNFFSRKF
jgi:hypothetical protein